MRKQMWQQANWGNVCDRNSLDTLAVLGNLKVFQNNKIGSLSLLVGERPQSSKRGQDESTGGTT